MASERARRLLLWCAATDRTFERREVGGREVLAGKCIHCNRALVVDLRSPDQGAATLEHIVPRAHGGSDALDNLALACPRCNHGKGARLDWRRRDDPALVRVIDTLRRRRRDRLRPIPEGLQLPPCPGDGRSGPSSPPSHARKGRRSRAKGRGRGGSR